MDLRSPLDVFSSIDFCTNTIWIPRHLEVNTFLVFCLQVTFYKCNTERITRTNGYHRFQRFKCWIITNIFLLSLKNKRKWKIKHQTHCRDRKTGWAVYLPFSLLAHLCSSLNKKSLYAVLVSKKIRVYDDWWMLGIHLNLFSALPVSKSHMELRLSNWWLVSS